MSSDISISLSKLKYFPVSVNSRSGSKNNEEKFIKLKNVTQKTKFIPQYIGTVQLSPKAYIRKTDHNFDISFLIVSPNAKPIMCRCKVKLCNFSLKNVSKYGDLSNEYPTLTSCADFRHASEIFRGRPKYFYTGFPQKEERR